MKSKTAHVKNALRRRGSMTQPAENQTWGEPDQKPWPDHLGGLPGNVGRFSHGLGPPRKWGSSGDRRWRGYVIRWIKFLSEVESEGAIVDGATNLKQQIRAAS